MKEYGSPVPAAKNIRILACCAGPQWTVCWLWMKKECSQECHGNGLPECVTAFESRLKNKHGAKNYKAIPARWEAMSWMHRSCVFPGMALKRLTRHACAALIGQFARNSAQATVCFTVMSGRRRKGRLASAASGAL